LPHNFRVGCAVAARQVRQLPPVARGNLAARAWKWKNPFPDKIQPRSFRQGWKVRPDGPGRQPFGNGAGDNHRPADAEQLQHLGDGAA